jgi:hypothetical protein
MDAPDRTPQHGTGKGYETRDLRPVAVLPWLAVVLVVITAVFVLLRWLEDAFDARRERAVGPGVLAPVAEETHLEPKLQVSPARDLEDTRRSENEILTSYDWIDRKRGVVRIPIDRAIELLAERGLPVRERR